MAELAEFLLCFLTHLVRLMTLRQAARLLALPWVPDRPFGPSTVQKVVRELARLELIERRRVYVPPPPELTAPLFAYHPDDPKSSSPDLAALATAIRNRPVAPCDEIVCIFATEKGAKCAGGVAPNLSKLFQLGHDAAVTSVLVEEIEERFR